MSALHKMLPAPRRCRLYRAGGVFIFAFLCPRCWFFFESEDKEIVKFWRDHHDAKGCEREMVGELEKL